jgi:SAM-dependent methyltransferase
VEPISRDFGFDRGLPIDRYYIEDFLSRLKGDIRGHVLEIKEALYTRKLGGDRVSRSDVLHVEPGNPLATIVADLTNAPHLARNTFDCIILTQTLQFIYDTRAAIRTAHRILKPGGVLLVTVPGIGQISTEDMERWGQYWSFTSLSVQRLLTEVFEQERVDIVSYGNVLTAIAFLHGVSAEELKNSNLQFSDPEYQVLIAARAVK